LIVVDASVAAKLVLTTEVRADKADALTRRCIQHGEPIVAPPLLPSEMTNILRQQMRRTGLPLVAARQLLADFFALAILLTGPADLYDRALQVADTFGLAAAYDAQYVALAQLLGCDLWTDDQALVRNLAGHARLVRWLGDYTGTEPV
jgi:predicted nucleic acid-binding protein